MIDFEVLMSNLPIGVAVIRFDRIIYSNTYLLNMTGYSYSDIKDKSVLDFLHPDDKKNFIIRLNKRKKGEPLREEAIFRLIAKDGSIILAKIETKTFTMQEENYVLLIVKNIGSSTLIYQPSEIIESLIDSLAFNNSFGIWVDDLNDNTIFVNNYLCEILEVTPNEIMSHKITDYLSPESKLTYRKMVEKRKENLQTVSYELTLLNRDGHQFHFRVIGSVLFDFEGNKIGSVGLFFNIDELKKSSKVLSLLTDLAFSQETKTENFWEEALKSFLAIFDLDFGLIFFEGEILSSIPKNINAEFFYDYYDEIIRTKEISLLNNIYSEIFNSKCYSSYYSIIPMREMSSGFLLLGAQKPQIFDETTKKLIEFFSSQLGLLYEIRAQILERTEERSFTNLLLEILSHDFVNANTSVFGYLELLKEHLKNKQYEKLEDYLERSIELLERSERIIETIQQLTKLRAFSQPKENLELRGIIESAIETHEVLLFPRKFEVELNCPAGLKFLGNTLIKEAFEKIFKLIAYFNEKEEIKVTILCTKERINHKKYVKCEITDNSSGIPEEMQPTLLQDLSRGDSRLKTEIGLSLYIAKLIIESLSGLIFLNQLSRDDGTKTTVYKILLPY